MTRVIAMILLSLLPGILSAKVATDYLRDYQGNNRLTYTATGRCWTTTLKVLTFSLIDC